MTPFVRTSREVRIHISQDTYRVAYAVKEDYRKVPRRPCSIRQGSAQRWDWTPDAGRRL